MYVSWVYTHRQTWVWNYAKLLHQQAEGTVFGTQRIHSNFLLTQTSGDGRLGEREGRRGRENYLSAWLLTAWRRLRRNLILPVEDYRLLLNM